MGLLEISKFCTKYAEIYGKKVSKVIETKVPQINQNAILRYTPKVEDTIAIKNKTPLNEILSYFHGVERSGKDFKPILDNPDSVFAKYYKEIQQYNELQLSKGIIKTGCFTQKPKLKEVELNDFKDFIYKNADKLNVLKEDYWKIVDEVSKEVQKSIEANPGGLRKEFIEKAGQIHKWSEIFRTQYKYKNGTEYMHKYYDKEMFEQAVKEYTQFVEEITGKKVLIGCPSRMNYPISALGMLNNPKACENVDYILLGHGHYSSLITKIFDPYTWRFSDNDKSIWNYIEKNIPKGKQVLVFCCETDGIKKAGIKAEEMVDKDGKIMYGIGNEVSTWFNEANPVKICESGIRHIKGHLFAKDGMRNTQIGETNTEVYGTAFNLGYCNEPKAVYYNLDFDKYRV